MMKFLIEVSYELTCQYFLCSNIFNYFDNFLFNFLGLFAKKAQRIEPHFTPEHVSYRLHLASK